MRIIYLHGFASSPQSRKARYFIEKLAAHGVPAEALDLAPDFENLTLTGQLLIVENAVRGESVYMVGSSLGGYLAALFAAEHPEVKRLVLLAPAFNFCQLWRAELGPEKLADWRKNGTIPVFHYGTGRDAQLGYRLLEDAEQYRPFPDFSQPCLLLHGLNDTVVPFENSAKFAAEHPNVSLFSYNSGHELTDVLDEIWKTSSTFLLDKN